MAEEELKQVISSHNNNVFSEQEDVGFEKIFPDKLKKIQRAMTTDKNANKEKMKSKTRPKK